MTNSNGQRSRSDRGAVIPLFAGVIGVLLTMTAFTVDFGRLFVRNREMQDIADVAAIEAARELDGETVAELQPVVEATVAEAAARNGESDADFVVELGTYDTYEREFIPHLNPTDVPNAVRVTPADLVDYLFVPGQGTARRDGIGLQLNVVPNPPPPPCPAGTCPPPPTLQPQPPEGAFTIGSGLATVDTSKAALLNQVVSTGLLPVGAPQVNLDAVSWQGLVDARVTFEDLAAILGFGSPTELVEAGPIPVDLFVDGIARVLQSNGDLTNSATLNSLLAVIDTSQTVDLGDLLYVATGSDQAAAESQLHVLQLLTGAAFIADDDHAIGSSFGAVLPGITSTALDLTVIEAPVFVAGPEGTTSPLTRQVGATVTNAVSTPVPGVPNVASVSLTGQLVTDLTSAGALGRLENVICTGVGGIAVATEATAVDVAVTLTGTLRIDVLGTGTGILNEPIAATGTLQTNPNTDLLEFVWDTEFDLPPQYFGPKRTLTSPTLGLAGTPITLTDGVTPTALGAGVADAITASLLNTVIPGLLTQVDNGVVAPVSDALGLGFAFADVWANQRICNAPILVP